MTNDTLELRVPAIDCDACLRAIENVLRDIGVTYLSGDAAAKTITVRPGRIRAATVIRQLETAGFAPNMPAPLA